MAVEIEKCKKCGSENIAYRVAGSGYVCMDCRYKDEPQTNADRIRSMSDEELAEFLFTLDHYWDNGQRILRVEFKPVNDNKKDILGWLQSEVKGSE